MKMQGMKYWATAMVLGAMLASASDALAGGRHGRHGSRRCGGSTYGAGCESGPSCGSCDTGMDVPCDVAPAPEMVEQTIMVPTMETVTRTILVTEYKRETRERTITVMNRVPKTETLTRNYTVMVPKTETRTVNYQVCKPVVTEETQQYTVNVPYTETREATRKVCKRVASTKMKTITVDEGHWEGPAPTNYANDCASDCASDCATVDGCASAAPSCDPCDSGRGRRFRHRRASYGSSCGGCETANAGPVWVANPVQKEIECTVYENVWEDQPYTYNVCVMKPETRERTVQKYSTVMEPKTRQVSYTRSVPEQRTANYQITRYECVPSEQTQTYTVTVPYQVEKEIQVQVCKMVPQTVMVPVGNNGCATTDGCASGNGCGSDNGCSTGSGRVRGRRCRGC